MGSIIVTCLLPSTVGILCKYRAPGGAMKALLGWTILAIPFIALYIVIHFIIKYW